MLMDLTPQEIIEIVGHDGQEVIWPQLPVPRCLRGHHIQEMQDVAYAHGHVFAPVEVHPRSGPQGYPDKWNRVFSASAAEKRFVQMIVGRKALLFGRHSSGENHVCAWDGSMVYDPNGSIYELERFVLKEAWLFTPLE